MKKSLFFGLFAATVLGANAQDVCFMDNSTFLNVGDDGKPVATVLPAETLLCEDENGALYLRYSDNAKPTNVTKGYKMVAFNGGDAVQLTSGVAGDTNPTFVSYEEGRPTGGWVFKYEAKKEGWVTVFSKINPKKQYLVMSGKETPVSYTLGVAVGADSFVMNQPEAEDGTIDFAVNPETANGPRYFVVATKQSKNDAGVLLWKNKVTGEIVAAEKNPTVKGDDNQQYSGVMEEIPGQNKPQFPWISADLASAPGEGNGFIQFLALEGDDITFCALGSKMVCNGFVYSAEQPSVTFSESTDDDPVDPVTISKNGVSFDSSSVGSIVVGGELNENAPIYNAQGARVGADAKGILIQNGKKFVRF